MCVCVSLLVDNTDQQVFALPASRSLSIFRFFFAQITFSLEWTMFFRVATSCLWTFFRSPYQGRGWYPLEVQRALKLCLARKQTFCPLSKHFINATATAKKKGYLKGFEKKALFSGD